MSRYAFTVDADKTSDLDVFDRIKTLIKAVQDQGENPVRMSLTFHLETLTP